MVDNRPRAEGDRVARAHGAQIEVDVLRGHEPGIEAADRLEHRLAVGEVRGRKRDVGPRDDQLDPLEFLERPVADLDRPARDDVMGAEALAKLLHPERIRDRVAVDERDRLAARLADPEVATRPARASLDVEMDEVVSLLVLTDNVSGRVLAVRVDDDHLDGRLLEDQTVQQRRDVPRLVADRRDDADEHQRLVTEAPS